jgi:hypothetical protein
MMTCSTSRASSRPAAVKPQGVTGSAALPVLVAADVTRMVFVPTYLVLPLVYEPVTECGQPVWAAVQEAVPLALGVSPYNVVPAGQTCSVMSDAAAQNV